MRIIDAAQKTTSDKFAFPVERMKYHMLEKLHEVKLKAAVFERANSFTAKQQMADRGLSVEQYFCRSSWKCIYSRQ